MIKNISILLYALFFGLSWNQNAELITQKIKLENAIREKVSTTVNKFLDPSQYIIVVNARLDFKPLSFNSSGSQDIHSTNVSETRIINDLSYQSNDIFLNNGVN